MTEKNLNFDEVINRKNTDSLKFDFAARRGRPEDLLPLWVADMDFKTSSLILDELQKRLEHGVFGYTETLDDYFEAVAGWLKERHGMEIEQNWLVKTPGIVFALAMAVKAYTEEGDAVLIQQPVYYPFSEVVLDNKRKLVSNDLVLGDDGKYHIDFNDFEEKIIKNNIRLFLLCSPHNPVGRVWTREELAKLAEICLKHNVIVVSDEIHEDFTYEGYKHVPFLNAFENTDKDKYEAGGKAAAADAGENHARCSNEELEGDLTERLAEITLVCTSPAKTFNLAGLQISNIIIPNSTLRHRFKRQIDAAGYSQSNTMGIIACKAAYRYGGEWYEALKKYLQGSLDFVREYLRNELPQVKLIEPEGTYLIWLDFRGLGLDGRALESLIVNKAKLWLDSGAIFGEVGKGFQRINIATSRSVLKEALERIRSAVEDVIR